MSIDKNFWIIKTKYILVNDNSSSNLVSKSVIKTLKIKIMLITDIFFKMTDEKIAESEFIVWFIINVTEISKIIIAWIINVKFEYILLLKCHWMQSVHLIDDYDKRMYMIQNDKDEWYNLSCLTVTILTETELTCR